MDALSWVGPVDSDRSGEGLPQQPPRRFLDAADLRPARHRILTRIGLNNKRNRPFGGRTLPGSESAKQQRKVEATRALRAVAPRRQQRAKMPARTRLTAKLLQV